MTADIITVLALVAGISWLGLMVVSTLRNRGGEEIAPNLRPGMDDQELETRRLETGQKVAIAFSAFLAISLPLYFLGETGRQENFVEDFAHESEERGEHLVEEFACFSCHGPLGVGGTASYVEKRSGVTVAWAVPSLDDVLYRYDKDELNFWVTFGRGNTPMPAWGLAGGGPLNELQVVDVVNYLATIQKDQQSAVDETPAAVSAQLARLDNADTTIAAAIINQKQTLAEIDQASADSAFITPIAEMGRTLLDNAGSGLDTDDDGLSDVAEARISELSAQAVAYFSVVEKITLDPMTPDAENADEAMAALEAAVGTDPILQVYINSIGSIVETGGEGDDTDGDGLSDTAEATIQGLMTEASLATVPAAIREIVLDPTMSETVSGVTDLASTNATVGGFESVAITTTVTSENFDRIHAQELAGLEFLEVAATSKDWEVEIDGVAAAMDRDRDEAERAVMLFNANCARCHTSGFSAGIPYTKESGSGGFGPALWDGRPVVQFGQAAELAKDDLLIQFLTKGSESETAYGLNGFGSGRMPAFGAILSADDIALLAAYLRGGNLDGME